MSSLHCTYQMLHFLSWLGVEVKVAQLLLTAYMHFLPPCWDVWCKIGTYFGRKNNSWNIKIKHKPETMAHHKLNGWKERCSCSAIHCTGWEQRGTGGGSSLTPWHFQLKKVWSQQHDKCSFKMIESDVCKGMLYICTRLFLNSIKLWFLCKLKQSLLP